MAKLILLLPFIGLLFCNVKYSEIGKTSCDLVGNWSNISMIIDPDGTTHSLLFSDVDVPEEALLSFAKKIDNVYCSGQGNLDLNPSTTLRFTKKKLYVKGTKVGSYKTDNDCKKIKLTSKPSDPEHAAFSQCQVVFRYKNIIVIKQGKDTVFYLRRDAMNPYFVGDQ